MKDPTDWLEDLTVFMKDDDIKETAAAMEPTLVFGGSNAAAAAWVGAMGTLAGILGAVTLSPAISGSWLTFIGYVVGAGVLLRFLQPLTHKLLGSAIAWATGLAMFWAFFLSLSAVMTARIDSAFWSYLASAGAGFFFGMMNGSLNPSGIRREDAWMSAALPLGIVSCILGTAVVRFNAPDADLVATAVAGAIAGGLFSMPMAILLTKLWDQGHGLRQMGLLYLHNDNFAPKAVAYLDRAITLNSNDAELYTLRGIAFSKMDQRERAEADWAKASTLAPDDPEPALHRGLELLRRDELDQAMVQFGAALALDPSSAKAHSSLGTAYERQGNLDEAIGHYTHAIEAVPDYAIAYASRAVAYLRKGDLPRALEDSEQALELNSEFAAAAVTRGHVLAAMGRIDEAEESYRSIDEMEAEPAVRVEAERALETLNRTKPAADASA